VEALLLIAAMACGLFVWRRMRKRYLLRRFGPDFEEYNRTAFRKRVVPSGDPRIEVLERLAAELCSRRGQLAIEVKVQGYGMALHHINKDGTFSARGPYFVSIHSRNWTPSKRVHLVRCIRARGGGGFRSSNPTQTNGLIAERGDAIIEYDTKKHPPVDIWAYAQMRESALSTSSHVDP
jgi:hypothetical protein